MKFKTKLNLFILPSILIPVVFVIMATFIITSNKIRDMEYELLNNNLSYILDKCETEYLIIKALSMENVVYYRDATKKQILNDISNTFTSNRTIFIQDIQTKDVIFSTQVEKDTLLKNQDILDIMAKSKKGHQEYYLKTDSENSIATMAVFAVYENWNWLIVCSVEKNMAFKFMHEALTLSLSVTFLFFLICIIFIYKISKRINQSFKILSEGASRFSKNNFDFNIKIKGNDEFGELANNFNAMAAEIKKNHDDLKESEKLLLAMAENYPNSYISIIEKDYSVGFTSGREFKKMNIDPNQFIGLKIEEIFGEHTDFVKEHYRKTFAGQESTFELYFNGQYQLYRTVPLKSEDSSIKRILAVVENITERKQFESRIQQTQKMDAIATLAGGIAHDFNNLLGVITGNVSYSLSLLNQDEELFEVLSDVQEGVKQSEKLTQQLLTFAKGGKPVKKTADINQLIKEASLFVTRGSKSRCEFELSENLSMVEVDIGQINQVISNLVINANQAMLPHGGIIYIRTVNVEIESDNALTLSAGSYIKITVEDKGIGISKKHLSKIFDPFFTTKKKGNGLGLSSVYSIIQNHSGHISVYSELNKGTVFHVYIPASQKVIEKTVKKMIKATHQSQGRVLIMDDQEPILKMVGRMLNSMGYETEFALDGLEAIEKFREAYQSQNPFNLVILDLTVPGGMGGRKTIMELLKIDNNIKALVSSGYSNDPIMANYDNYGFCGVVPKPYTKTELSEVLNTVNM
ncbi:multi-sensor hybrid histidine kinase [Candidatus Magnetomorum sp. HK-1]|nr:multi-sensor hybrid histidine kinase [Candidatus Magnetomorum sp. HK-1]